MPNSMDAPLRTYLSSYPSEDHKLKEDVNECARQLANLLEEHLKPPGGLSNDERMKWKSITLHPLYEELLKQSEDLNKNKPIWKRLLGGTRFNYSPAPIPERGCIA